jgi:predicted O-methyltransferase YrrM
MTAVGEVESNGVEREFGDGAARVALGALRGPYLPWGSGAMRPAGLVMVCNDIVLGDRRRVVELGSGLSTVLLARLLAQRGGAFALVAVEHDAGWARWVREQLEREGIGEHVTVIDAPLTARAVAPDGLLWYDEAALAAGLDGALGAGAIDLLVVDGPPAYAAGQGLGRYPALPALRGRLAPGATVVLDDVERPGEQDVLHRWESETDLVFQRHAGTAGIALARCR